MLDGVISDEGDLRAFGNPGWTYVRAPSRICKNDPWGFPTSRSQSGVSAGHHRRSPRDHQQRSGEPNGPTSRTSHHAAPGAKHEKCIPVSVVERMLKSRVNRAGKKEPISPRYEWHWLRPGEAHRRR